MREVPKVSPLEVPPGDHRDSIGCLIGAVLLLGLLLFIMRSAM